MHRNKILYNKTNRCTNFPNLFWLKKNLYMFRAGPLPIIRSSLTVPLALVYVTRFEGSFQAGYGWNCSCLQTVWHIPVSRVQLTNSWWWAEELPETCRGLFFSQNKFGNLVHLLVLLYRNVYEWVTLGSIWGSGIIFTLRSNYPRKGSPINIEYEAECTIRLVWLLTRRKNVLSLPKMNHNFTDVQFVAQSRITILVLYPSSI